MKVVGNVLVIPLDELGEKDTMRFMVDKFENYNYEIGKLKGENKILQDKLNNILNPFFG